LVVSEDLAASIIALMMGTMYSIRCMLKYMCWLVIIS
jgi:hypothetical protein